VAVIAVAALLLVGGCTSFGGKSYYDPAKPHHVPGGFRNIGSFQKSEATMFEWLVHYLDMMAGKTASRDELPKGIVMPAAEVRRELRRSARYGAAMTWIGHATALIRIGRTRILLDPVFSTYVAVVPPFGPKRILPPALRIDELPKIDVILISHDHRDHLDRSSLRKLVKRNPNVKLLVPLGNARHVDDLGFKHIVELDWYDRYRVGPITFRALPAQHNGRRRLLSRNSSLWAGWGISGLGRRIYYSGDTGYSTVFRQARRRAGAYSTAIMSIGAYHPRRREREDHATPEQALRIARTMGARRVIAVHWATFALSDEPVAEPGKRFMKAPARGMRRRIIRLGETIPL